MKNQAFIIDGARTAFMKSSNRFSALSSLDLGRYVLNGLVKKTGISTNGIEYVCMGTVIQDPDFPNIARESVLESVLQKTTPAHTVNMACISSNVAATSIACMIKSGQIGCGIAGGVESFSDLPIRFSKNLRSLLIRSKKTKGLKLLSLWSRLRPRDLKPDIPAVKEHSTGFSMGESGDQIAHRFGITRKDADDFALLSHQRAVKAWNAGHYKNQVILVDLSLSQPVAKDDGPRPSDPSILAKLPTAFGRFGINTSANSSFFADGSSAILMGNSDFCEKNGLSPLALIKDYFYAAGDPIHELLLGPALTVPLLLHKHNLKVSDIDIWEIHEAFAGQVLANLRAMASNKFCEERLGLQALAEIPLDRVNLWGGSLSLGHPFGATGTRLLLTASQRLIEENGRLAIVTGCAASGLGCAVLLERGR